MLNNDRDTHTRKQDEVRRMSTIFDASDLVAGRLVTYCVVEWIRATYSDGHVVTSVRKGDTCKRQ